MYIILQVRKKDFILAGGYLCYVSTASMCAGALEGRGLEL
jgi:hypothetical protein